LAVEPFHGPKNTSTTVTLGGAQHHQNCAGIAVLGCV
jgi:hypothetical protein